jgi:hypothetical protein
LNLVASSYFSLTVDGAPVSFDSLRSLGSGVVILVPAGKYQIAAQFGTKAVKWYGFSILLLTESFWLGCVILLLVGKPTVEASTGSISNAPPSK